MPPPDSKPRLVKLLRDNIGRYLGSSEVLYEQIPDREEFIKSLRGKMLEEYLEYLLEPSIDELADMLQVLHDLAKNDLKISWGQVEIQRLAKEADRGGFNGLGMYVYTTAKQHG